MQRAYNKITFLSTVIAVLLIMLFIEAFATPETMLKNVEINSEILARPEQIAIKAKATNISIDNTDTIVTTMEVASNLAEVVTVTQLEQRSNIIDTKQNSFVTTKTLKENDVVKVEPIYDSDNKQIIERRSESMCLDIRSRSNWTYEDFDAILNEEMKDLIPVALRLEEEVGINAIYIIAVGANETGWGKHMAGDYNYFNWTNDGKNHFNFETLEEFSDFSVETYGNNYIDETFYQGKLGFVPDHITLEVVNVKYAINSDKTTNWLWSNVVAEIMSSLSDRRLKNV